MCIFCIFILTKKIYDKIHIFVKEFFFTLKERAIRRRRSVNNSLTAANEKSSQLAD